MEPRAMLLAWIDQDIAALNAVAAPVVPLGPPWTVWRVGHVPCDRLLARSAEVMAALRELADEARALRQEAQALRVRAAVQDRPWTDIWGVRA